MDEPIQPLPRSIYDKAKANKISEIHLFFRGGDDSGYLTVDFCSEENGIDQRFSQKFEAEVEAWAWEAYEYSGAGDGVPYGDNISYDLDNNKVTVQSWYHEKKYDVPEFSKIEIKDKEDEGEDE